MSKDEHKEPEEGSEEDVGLLTKLRKRRDELKRRKEEASKDEQKK